MGRKPKQPAIVATLQAWTSLENSETPPVAKTESQELMLSEIQSKAIHDLFTMQRAPKRGIQGIILPPA